LGSGSTASAGSSASASLGFHIRAGFGIVIVRFGIQFRDDLSSASSTTAGTSPGATFFNTSLNRAALRASTFGGGACSWRKS
jgi:hypothetical protein